jgi:hypothetical protein
MINLKEHNFPYESFIGGWYIPEKLCNDILETFKKNIQAWEPGKIGHNQIDYDRKESTDMYISKNDFKFPFDEYRKYISQIIKNYELKYEELKKHWSYNIVEDYNIQYYKPNQGFKSWHCERSAPTHRMLVFMTYLNDVEDGGTEFKYQKIISPAKKGLTLLWPSDFTHTHKGQISEKYEKFIVTGWLSYEPSPKDIKNE